MERVRLLGGPQSGETVLVVPAGYSLLDPPSTDKVLRAAIWTEALADIDELKRNAPGA